MAKTKDVLRIVGAVEQMLPVVVGLIKSLRGLADGSDNRSADEILNEADLNWAAVIAAAKKEIGQP